MMERRKRGTGAGSGPCLCTFWSGGNREVGSRETLGSFIHWWRTFMTDMSLKSDPESGKEKALNHRGPLLTSRDLELDGCLRYQEAHALPQPRHTI